ncbi:hypothetical protein [Candidatus Methylocalor cossyra]|uniref:Uncharacterized protein n=1 Tax=Candidatus Methylocalor cossyra TaxID=3108543 RepID=A0ABM9NK47_9GAMM
MRKANFLKSCAFAIGLLAVGVLPAPAWAHGGASVETDVCRIQIGSHLVHFTAYQPQLTGTTEYCNVIPELGNTTLVFDYEGKALRNMTVEFEITKEPEGTRVFYQPPSTHPTGTFNTTVNFTEPSKYLAHITLVNEGQKVDEHIGFTVGAAQGGPSISTYLVIGVVLLAAGYIFYLSNASFKNAVDGLTRKKA